MKLNQSLKRLEVYTKKFVQGKEKKAKREKYKDWTLDMLLEVTTLEMYFPGVPREEIDQDILTRGFRLPSDDQLVIAYGIRIWGADAYRDPWAVLDTL